MKARYAVFALSAILLFSSFKTSEACEYAGSNISYVKTQTALAIEVSDLNKAKFYTYKAMRALYQLRNQLSECGCEQAIGYMEETQYNLREATKATSFEGAKILLQEAYNKTVESLVAIEEHHLHENPSLGNAFAMNTTGNPEILSLPNFHLEKEDIRVLIDDSLIPYEKSLQNVVDSVDCKTAREFAQRIFKICEQELLKPNLSEGKKYYNLKTQEITANALKQLNDCGPSSSK